MKLYAQHGFQPGKRIGQALSDQLIDGVIYSAKDTPPTELAPILAQQAKGSDRFFDPQYYACMIAGQPGARPGWLLGEEGYPYFRSRRRAELEREATVRADLEACLAFQAKLPLSGLIAPNIVIRRTLDSIEGSIAKEFIRNTASVAQEIARKQAVYATLAISASALVDRVELQNFLQEITELDTPPDGFYLLIERPDQAISPSLAEQDVLSGWMLINHTLQVNGFKTINGYSDLLAPYLGAAGGFAAACGWWNTLKAFSLKKFEPAPNQFMRKAVPKEGSEPAEGWHESLQNWEALRTMISCCTAKDVRSSTKACHRALIGADDLYGRIADVGYTLRDRSSNAHIEAIRYELEAFSELAEI
jgi:hypothetical protein